MFAGDRVEFFWVIVEREFAEWLKFGSEEHRVS